jgi:asparagine synthase (glutamine-hydrolysing)
VDLQIDEVAVDRVRWVVSADRSVADLEMPSLAWEEYDRLLDRARQAGCRVLLNGFFGDQILTGEAYLVDLLRRGRWGLVRRHLRETAAWMTDVDPRILRQWFLRAAVRAIAPSSVRRLTRVAINRTLKRVPYAPWFTKQFRERALERGLTRAGLPRRFESAHMEEYWRLATSGYYLSALLQGGSAGRTHQLEMAYPFRDRDLVEFLMGIPGDAVIENGIPKALLRRSLEGVLPDRIRLRRSKGDGTAFSNNAALAEEETVRRLLDPDSLSARAGFIDVNVLRAQMPALFGTQLKREDTAEFGWQIGDTLALELWLQRFCGGVTCN